MNGRRTLLKTGAKIGRQNKSESPLDHPGVFTVGITCNSRAPDRDHLQPDYRCVVTPPRGAYLLEIGQRSFVAGLGDRLHGVDLSAGVLERQFAADDAVHVLRAAGTRWGVVRGTVTGCGRDWSYRDRVPAIGNDKRSQQECFLRLPLLVLEKKREKWTVLSSKTSIAITARSYSGLHWTVDDCLY